MTLDHLGCSKTHFWAVLTPFRTVWRHCLAPTGIQMAHFWTERGSKKKAKNICFKKIQMTLDHLRFSNMHSEPVFRLFLAILRLHLAPNPLELPHFGIRRGSKKGQKCVSPQVALATPRMLKHIFWAVLEPKKGQNCLAKHSHK